MHRPLRSNDGSRHGSGGSGSSEIREPPLGQARSGAHRRSYQASLTHQSSRMSLARAFQRNRPLHYFMAVV